MKCQHCGGDDCIPIENNSLGYEIQKFVPKTGWESVPGEPFAAFCLAETAMDKIPKDKFERRVYSKLVRR